MSFVTLLFPFDHGYSYVLPPDFSWEKALIQLPPNDNEQWSADCGFRPETNSPLGKPVVLNLGLQSPDLITAIKSIPFLSTNDEVQASVLFYPIGISILILRGRVNVSNKQRGTSFTEWEMNAYDGLFETLAHRTSKSFRSLTQKFDIPEIYEVDRSKSPLEFPWIYAIFFDKRFA